MSKIKLLPFLRGEAGSTGYGPPVGVKYHDGREGIFQVRRVPGSRRWLQLKGAWNNPPPPAHIQEHWYDASGIYFAIDTSRREQDGGPYTLYDTPGVRGHRWLPDEMALNEVFERNPHVAAFELATGKHKPGAAQHRTWIRLEALHENWRGLGRRAIELAWYSDAALKAWQETYVYIEGCGLGGFRAADGQSATAQHIWALPPARLVPELVPMALAFPLTPELPENVTPPLPADGFTLLKPWHRFRHFQWHNFGERHTPEPGDGDAKEFHGGLDVTFASGTTGPYPIVAAAAGRVVLAGWDTSGYGNVVKLDHGSGRETLYAHLEPQLLVKVGDVVERDQVIGHMGYTGRVVPQGEAGRHLHFEYREGDVTVNPTPLLRDPEPVVIEPPDPQPESEPPPPVVTPLPDAGLVSLLLTVDEARQFQTALIAERDAKDTQIRIIAAALARAGAA